MELWFMAAIASAFFGGISNFAFKVAAKRNYNSSVFSLYGGVTAIGMLAVALLIYPSPVLSSDQIKWLAFLASVIAAFTGIMKVIALRYIDSTIYFPLYKLLAPLLAIIMGVVLFSESFTLMQWAGMLLSLFVPLLLITKSESGRQNNLALGLLVVLVTGLTSTVSAVLYKYAMDGGIPVLVALWFSAWGILVGSMLSIVYTKGARATVQAVKEHSSYGLIYWGCLRAVLITVGFGFMLYAYANGSLAIVQTVHSFYILIPIVLAIIIYGEHWNLQKAIAIFLSVGALALMG